jgi:hypothetical protein
MVGVAEVAVPRVSITTMPAVASGEKRIVWAKS